MRDLLKNWDRIADALRRAAHRLYLFDYDGTLSPIRRRPVQARVPPSTHQLLRKLLHQRASSLGFISGRTLSELRQKIRLPGATYAGNHGLEFYHHGRGWVHPKAKAQKGLLHQLTKRLGKVFVKVPGVFVENKELTLSVHFQQVPASHQAQVRRMLWRTLGLFCSGKRWSIRAGKKTIEIKPLVHWDKGSMVRWLLQHSPAETLALYVGDDTTDEDVFRVLKTPQISVRIGQSRRSHAAYYLKRQRSVPALLERLVKL